MEMESSAPTAPCAIQTQTPRANALALPMLHANATAGIMATDSRAQFCQPRLSGSWLSPSPSVFLLSSGRSLRCGSDWWVGSLGLNLKLSSRVQAGSSSESQCVLCWECACCCSPYSSLLWISAEPTKAPAADHMIKRTHTLSVLCA